MVHHNRCSQNATALNPFDVSNYLGAWYEIAVTEQFREQFEQGLVCTSMLPSQHCVDFFFIAQF